MGVLYVISIEKPLEIVFEMASRESVDVTFLFVKEARKLVANIELMGSLDYAVGIYCLDEVSKTINKAQNIQIIDYLGWVKLLEKNTRIISWN
jgi:hypothetical protein